MASIVANVIPANSRKNTSGKTQKTYTVRYRDTAGKQREKTFKTKREAETFITDQDMAARYGNDVDVKAGKESFIDAADAYLRRLAVSETTKQSYRGSFNAHIKDMYAGKTLRDVANDRGTAEDLLNVTMLDLALGTRRTVRLILTGIVNDAVNRGTIDSHRLNGIKLAEKPVTDDDEGDGDGFVYLTDDQVASIADKVGMAIWLQRTMGLRIREALGVEKSDFIEKDGRRILRLRWQATRDGRTREPLKHRRAHQGRDIPVPEFIWNMVKDMPDGPITPGVSTKYLPYATARGRLGGACARLGIWGVTSHSLRHLFATDSLARGMNIANLAKWLGHKDASITLRVYVHPTDNAMDEAWDMMNDRWSVKPALKAA